MERNKFKSKNKKEKLHNNVQPNSNPNPNQNKIKKVDQANNNENKTVKTIKDNKSENNKNAKENEIEKLKLTKNHQENVKENIIKAIISCNETNNNNLPIIKLNLGRLECISLLDSGANVSLTTPSIIDKIKKFAKVNYLSRAVKIKTLDGSEIPYLATVKLKFKIEGKWFENVFYITQNDWNSKYNMILGYDFLQNNKIMLDAENKQLIVNNNYFPFQEITPKNNIEDTDIVEEENSIQEINVAKLVNNIKILPNQYEFVKIKLPKNCSNQNIIFKPGKIKQPISIEESLHIVDTENCFLTILENKTDKIIYMRKNQKLGYVENFENFDFKEPKEESICQVNNLTLSEVKELRKKELAEEDFDLKHLSIDNRKEILDLLMKNYDIFSKSYTTLGSTDKVVPEFKLLHNYPLITKPYAIPHIAKKFAREEIAKLLKAGIIEESTSSYSFPVIFVKKKPFTKDPNKQNFRLVIDYRVLNSITESFQICLPKINEIIQNISGRKLYCVLDLKSAFFQIQLKKEDRHKLAFCTEFGSYAPTRLPFGLRNSVSYFNTLINKCLNNLRGKNVQFFLDDIIIATDSLEEMKVWLQKVFDQLRLFNLTLDPAKLQIAKEQITYLGFKLHGKGYSPSEQNIVKINNFPIPKNVKQVQMFIGTINYFRHLIFNFAELLEPIVRLTRKNTKFIWDEKCQNAFNKIQEIILQNPTLKNIDYEKELYLVTDASKVAISAILMQKEGDNYIPIEFFSKQLSPAESNYPSIRRELFAIFASIKYFREILYGRKFFILTDAKPLTKHINLANQPEIVARWLLFIQSFNYEILHIAGHENPADFLSRVYDENKCINVIQIDTFNTNNNLSKEKLLQYQLKDEQCIKLKENLEDNKKKDPKYFIDSNSNLLMLKCKKTTGKLKNKVITNKIFIPKLLIKEILTQAHAPHFGFKKTYQKVNRMYFWPGMYKDTQKFCANCSKCMENKPKATQTKYNLIEKSQLAPGEFLAIDIVGKLPRSLDNKNFVLTILDHYSRFLEAIPLQNAKSIVIIKTLENYFARFGIPKILLTDNATNFCSIKFEKFLKNLNIQHRKSSIYYPQSNGAIERVHRIMKESIAAMCNQIFEWSDRLLFFKLEYNNSKHAVTKFAPAELFFGRQLNVPDAIFKEPLEVEGYSKYFEKLIQHLTESKKLLIQNEKKYFEQQTQHIKGRNKPNFEMDEIVYLKNFQHVGTLQKKYIGPFKILKKLRNDNYIIQNAENENDKEIKIHVSKIFGVK